MNLDADRMSRCQGLTLPLLLAMLLAFFGLVETNACADDGSETSKAPTSTIKLPPRSNSREATSVEPRRNPSSGGGLWTTVVSLTVIVGTLGSLGYWLKPYLGVTRGLPIEAVELLGRRSLEQKVAIHLVRCGGRILVLSVSPEGARTLAEIADPVEVRELVGICHASRDSKSVIPDSLASAFAKEAKPIGPAASSSRTATPRSPLPGEDSRRG